MNIKEKKITDLHVSIPESAGKDTKLINMNMLAGLGHFYIARQQQKNTHQNMLTNQLLSAYNLSYVKLSMVMHTVV